MNKELKGRTDESERNEQDKKGAKIKNGNKRRETKEKDTLFIF